MSPAKRISVLVCDDHRMLSDSLAIVIRANSALRLVAPPVDSGEAAIRLAEEHRPDVVLMDIHLRGAMTGLEATRRIKEICPDTGVIIMSGSEKGDAMVDAVEAGASGFLDKTEAVERVLEAVTAVANGDVLLDPSVLMRMMPAVARRREERVGAEGLLAQLTAREKEILQLLSQGLRNDDIARDLHISIKTVETHGQNILKKLGVHSKLEAVALAAKHGVVSLSE